MYYRKVRLRVLRVRLLKTECQGLLDEVIHRSPVKLGVGVWAFDEIQFLIEIVYEPTIITQRKMSNVQVLAKAEILDTEVDALFARRSSEDGKLKIKDSIILVYGNPELPREKTITELLAELAKLFSLGNLSNEDFKAALPEGMEQVFDKIKLSVRQIYFLKTDRKVVETNDNLDDPKKPKGEWEKEAKKTNYALWVDLILDPTLLEQFPIKVKSVSLKIWETTNKKVLEQMGVFETQNMLDKAGVAAN